MSQQVHNMPGALKVYLLIIYAAAAVLAAVLIPQLAAVTIPWPATIAVLLCALIADLLPNAYRNVEASATDALLMAGTLLLPPPVLAVVIVLATLPSELLARKEWFKVGFNLAYRLILFQFIALVAVQWGGLPDVGDVLMPLLLCISVTLLYTLITTVSIAAVIALLQRAPLIQTWREEWRALSLFDLALIPYGIMLAWLWQISVSAFVVGILPLAIVHRAFNVQVRLFEEQEATQRLVRQQRQLQEATTILLATTDLKDKISALLAHLRNIFSTRGSSVILWDEDGQIEHLQHATGADIDPQQLLPILREVATAGVMRHLAPGAVLHIDTYALILPLATAAGPLGCLLLINDTPLPLTPDQEAVLTTFAGQAALAIYQARLAEQVKQSQQQVLQASRLASVGTLAAGVAHEFNNLLAVIAGTAEIAEGGPADEQERALKTIEEAARRGSSVTRGLLTFARRLAPQRQLAPITDAIEPVLALLEHEFTREQIVVERRYQSTPLTVYDLGMISQVVLNLLNNARDAMRPRGGKIVISVDQAGSDIRLAVRDNGSGIPPDMIERIFDPFVTTKASPSGSGTGLGLSISYGIVADHNGRILAESIEGQGTTMTVLLPIVEPADMPKPALPLPDNPPAQRVVVVDDEPLIGQAIQRYLSKEGYGCRVFTRPEDALGALRTAPADLVIADLSMPGMDGVTFIERVGALQGPTDCLLITGEVEERHIQRARAAGVKRILEKPFRMQELRDAIAELRSGGSLPPL